MVDQQHIGIAPPRQPDRLTGAHGDNPDLDPGGLGESRQDVIEQAGILGRRGRRDGDVSIFGGGEP